jgi:antitoxin VapB
MTAPSTTRRARLFRNNRNQAVRIPVEFEMPGEEVILRRDGDRLIIEPLPVATLLDLVAGWAPLDEDFPDIDADLPPLRDVAL